MDLLLVPTLDGGDLDVRNGQAALDDTPKTALYLSLFGGNVDDSGDSDDDLKQWWGNFIATDPVAVYRSRTQYALSRYPATTGNLIKIRDAATTDVEWLRSYFDDIKVTCSLPEINRVRVTIDVTINGATTPYFFDRQWTR